jgi:CheY-like chemotaxis protein
MISLSPNLTPASIRLYKSASPLTLLQSVVKAAADRPRGPVQKEPLVLLVEDDTTAREGYVEFLERAGFRVAQSDNAEEAYALSKTLGPDIVVTDIALPGRDGFSLAADLRVQAVTRGIPVVAITAYWATDVRQRADHAGITAVLLKPCQPQHLVAELHRVLQRPRRPRRTKSAKMPAKPLNTPSPETPDHS